MRIVRTREQSLRRFGYVSPGIETSDFYAGYTIDASLITGPLYATRCQEGEKERVTRWGSQSGTSKVGWNIAQQR